ncbi:hydroxymethylpyrimidine kinase / phosphomethylpyrimidine kinase / thiamine-phosphate diphosphorylase [Pseudoalteromonas ulvae UL12]|uniref:thiamine phosphate synthase n=1 Tax=Pseudoalteromonas ulvae TaxID=107327 RepID=UPI00186B67B7|nr:thiamine phosphate synthase [Pseudoalteromonas ulvae]MBE0365109.1 hydroxymethylpyrimidine kinase / phosphomethylpyrimidine kinase / thiamine-phosphate diphosphorylase [Pseudoalteromonas ulvae UL12]
MKSIIWTIAGSDSSGGAGIQADIKAIESFGGHACTIITALTAQNSMGVDAINAVSIEVLESQFSALESDMPANVIKIGLLANVQQVEFIAAKLAHFKAQWETPPLVVYDPVAVASSGEALTEDDIIPTLKSTLLPLVDVITPNTQETQILTGHYLIGPSAVRDASEAFFNLGVGAAMIKGGHWDYPQGYCIDYCAVPGQEYWLGNEKIIAPHSHGTGCSFASSVAACLGLGYPLKDAFILAKAYINQGLKVSVRIGQGIGPVSHCGFPQNLADFPEVIEAGSWLGKELELEPWDRPVISGFAASETQQLGLYAVVDSCEWLKICLENGIKTAQLRIKNSEAPDLSEQVKTAIALGEEFSAQVYINDHWQLAIEHGAYGVHLGQEDLDSADLAAIKQAGLRLGLSTHGFFEMLRAHNYQPSYLAFGAIYPTTTKDMTGQIQGLEKLKHFVPLMEDYPTVAIGGIDLARAPEVAATQVGSVAVVRAITEAADPSQAINLLQAAIKRQH